MKGIPYWYVVGRVNGRTVFDGPHVTEAKAFDKGASITDWDSNDWAPKMYYTSDKREAKSMWKSEQAAITGSMGESLRPIYGVTTAKKGGSDGGSDRKTRLQELKEERGL